MADYTGIKIFSITLNGATHPTTGTVSSIGEMYVRDIGDTKGTLGYNNGGPTDEETGQTLTVGGTDYTDVTDVTHGTITVDGVEVSGTFLSVLDPNTAAQVDFFIPDATDGEDAELLDVGGAITATAVDPASESMDYADMYATPSHSVVGSGSDDTIDATYTGDKTGDTVDNTGGDNSDVIYARSGDDTIDAGEGNDTVYGEAGDDTFIVKDGFENDFYVGGETEETTGDTLDASSMTNDVTIDMGQTVETSYAAMVLDVTIDEDTNNNIIAGYGNYIPHLGQATITDTGVDSGVAGSSATALEPGSGVTDTGGTSITIDGVVYTSFGRIEQVDVITVDGTITGHLVAAYTDGNATPTALFLPDAGATNEANLSNIDPDTLVFGFGLRSGDVSVSYSDLIETETVTGGTITSGAQIAHFTEMERIETGSGDDQINGDDSDLAIEFNAGNDTIITGSGDDLISGGDGDDVITSGAGDDTIDGGAGTDVISSGDGNDSISGGDGDDSIAGGEGHNTINAGSGADTITAGSGDDTVDAGTGDDSIDAGDGANEIDAGDGDDVITTGTGDDTIDGGTGADVISSGDGNDSIAGGEGHNNIIAGSGADTITAGTGDDTVDAGTGDDSINAGDGANDIDAGDGDDTIVTGDGNDTIDGGAGDDTFVLTGGDDTITGGEGSDIFDWDGTGDIEITDFDAGTSGQEDEDQDVVDLSKYYADLNDLRADFADDGVLNQSTGDYSDMSKLDGSLTFANDDGSLTADDLTTENTRVTCFADTVMVMTDMGERMVGELGQGDMVLTMDSGYAPVRWIGQRSLDAAHFAQHPAHRPIRIRQGALGPNMPSRDLIVSPQHRVLVRSDLAHQVTGQPEALVAAKHLLPLPGVTVADDMDAVTYVHIMFDQHEVVFSDGLATESFYTGDQAMAALAPAARAEIMAIFPELQSADFSKTPSARPFLDGEQGVMLAKAHKSEKRALLA